MRLDAAKETFYPLVFRGMTGLFTDMRIDRNSVPKGWYLYEVRESDEGCEPAEISEWIMVNFYGTILTQTPVTAWDDEYNGKHGLYLKFSDEPEWYEDEDGITEAQFSSDGENTPHYCPLESEWNVDYEKPYTIENYLLSLKKEEKA